MNATLKTIWATFTMSTNEGAKHGDEDEHIHENVHQVIIHFLEGLEFHRQLLIRHFFVSLNTKLSPKDKTNPRKKKLKIFFQMDVKVGGNPVCKTHILKVPFLIKHHINPQCS